MVQPQGVPQHLADIWARAVQGWCQHCGRVHWRYEWERCSWRCPTIYCSATIEAALPWCAAAMPSPAHRIWPLVAEDGAYYPVPLTPQRHDTGSVVCAHKREAGVVFSGRISTTPT